MLIHTEQTPNPATRKFLPGQTVMEDGGRDFPNGEAAEATPLAAALFAIGMGEGVFFGRDFISVTAPPGAAWDELEPEVAGVLTDQFVSGAPLFWTGSAAGIEGVFFGRAFISVTAATGVAWDELEPEVFGVLLDHFVSGAPLFRAGTAAGIHVAAGPDFEEDPADAELIAQLQELIETRVRP